MKNIYLDELFAINLAADYLICLLSAKICAVPLRRRRYFLAALIGAGYAAAVYLPGLRILNTAVVRLAVGILLALICFRKEAHTVRCCAVFFAVSALFGGAAAALIGEGGINIRTLALCFALCFGVFSLVFRNAAELPDKKRSLVHIEFCGRSTEFFALHDTGNSLRDPLSGKKVMLISLHTAAELFPDCAELFCLGDAVHTLEKLNEKPEYSGRFRLLPCSTVAADALLPVFRPDRLIIDGKIENDILAAVSENLNADGFEGII